MRELYKQAKKRYRVPDTAHDCPILRIGVVHDQPVSERKNLWNVELTGKFRKVASHSAPEPAFGLFLNLSEGSAPWNPGTSIA